MARRTTISIEGLERLRAQLGEVPGHITQGAQNAVSGGSEAVRDQVRAEVRVDTGRLKRDIDIREIGTKGLTADVGWFKDEDYYAQFNEFGTSSITADPVLTRSAEAEQARFEGRVTQEVREELDKL